jgi:hypothetical protein
VAQDFVLILKNVLFFGKQNFENIGGRSRRWDRILHFKGGIIVILKVSTCTYGLKFLIPTYPRSILAVLVL